MAFDLGNILKNVGTSLGGWGQGSLGGSLLGSLGGAAIGSMLAPRAPSYTPITAAQLNAATIPAMQTAANNRMAALAGALGAKGGMSSADLYEKAALNQQLAQGIGQQQVQNQMQAANYANQIAQLQDAANRQRFQDIMSGGMLGYRLMNPMQAPTLPKPATPTTSYTPAPIPSYGLTYQDLMTPQPTIPGTNIPAFMLGQR